MKKLFRFGLISLALSLCIGSGVMAFRSAKQPVKTSADTQTVTFTKVREGFIERGGDPDGGLSTLSLSSTAFSGAKHQDTLSSGHIGVNMGESSSSKIGTLFLWNIPTHLIMQHIPKQLYISLILYRHIVILRVVKPITSWNSSMKDILIHLPILIH